MFVNYKWDQYLKVYQKGFKNHLNVLFLQFAVSKATNEKIYIRSYCKYICMITIEEFKAQQATG